MAVKAVQQIMLGSVMKSKADAKEVLGKIKAAGYDGIELNGFMIRPTPFLVRMLTKFAGMPVGKGGKFDWATLVNEAGLSVVSIHEDLGAIKREPETVVAEAKTFGTKFVVVTGMYRFDYSDEAAVSQLAQDLNEAGKRLLENGIYLLYHNHNCELRKISKDKTAYDLLIEKTNPEYVNFEFDSYWFAGGNAPTILPSFPPTMAMAEKAFSPSLTALAKAVRSAQIVGVKAAFSMLQPVYTLPSLVSNAAPTKNPE